MPVRIVFDHHRTHITSWVVRHLSWVVGALFICVGLLAAVAAIPSGLVFLVDIVTRLQRSESQTFEPDFPVRQFEAAFAVALLVAFFGLRYGLRLTRGRRRTVLFLRRFGFDGAQQVVTFAVASTIGATWRLVTLDDAEMAPIGVDPAATFVFGLAKPAGRIAAAAHRVIFTTYTWTIYGMCGVIGVEIARTPEVGRLFDNGTVDTYMAIVQRLMDARVPVDYFSFSLPGIFAILATAFGFAFIGVGITFLVLLAPIPLFPVVWMAGSSARALREAETSKTATIQNPPDISRVVREVLRRGQRVFAPRLVVVRVATLLWPATVNALASSAAAVIVDISDPTENVLWELETIERLCPARYILIGDEASIRHWANDIHAEPAQSFRTRFARQLGDREVLAYTTDNAGMRRFARALHRRLLDLPSGPVG